MAHIGLGVLLLLSSVGCFLAVKRWHWSHIFLGEVLFLSALFGIVVAADVLDNNKRSREGLANLENRLERTIPLAKAVVDGTRNESVMNSLKNEDVPVVLDPNPDNPGAMQGANTLEHRLAMMSRLVGRKWGDVKPGAPNPATGAVTVQVEFPSPHGIEENAILYVFEEGEPVLPNFQQGPQYLGEFRVTGVAETEVQITPEGTWSDFQKQRLGVIRARWILYETMPMDQYPDDLLQLFAGVEGAEFDQLIAPGLAEEYKRHGTEARVDEDEFEKVGLDADGNVVPASSPAAVRFVYQRQLQDYAFQFLQFSRDWIRLLVDKEALVADVAKMQTALASAKKLQAYREDEQRKLKIDKAGVVRDREIIEKHLANVEASLSNATALLEATLAENARMVRQLAELQFAAVEAINAKNPPVPAQPADGIEFGS